MKAGGGMLPALVLCVLLGGFVASQEDSTIGGTLTDLVRESSSATSTHHEGGVTVGLTSGAVTSGAGASEYVSTNSTLMFLCTSSMNRISVMRVCDGHADCEDASDERGCSRFPVLMFAPETEMDDKTQHRFLCASGQLVPLEKVCDGTPDCENGTDEELCGARQRVAKEKMSLKDKLDEISRSPITIAVPFAIVALAFLTAGIVKLYGMRSTVPVRRVRVNRLLQQCHIK